MITVLFQGWHANALDFVHEVAPLLKKKCGECHTGGARQGGFSINTRDDLLRGGDSELPGFISGDSDNSEIISRVTSHDPDYRMPSDNDPLSPQDINLLKTWINEGAIWENGFVFETDTWEPPLKLRGIVLPPIQNGRTNPVDRIVDHYFQEKHIQRPPQSDDRTFLRRVSLDLVGLLPQPDVVQSFIASTNRNKRHRFVEELLSDSTKLQYAEHWLSFWNDLLRNDYSGTGFITGGRRQITTWLHRSLMENKPYDQFVRELIAPTDESRGFIDGIVWRGTVNASQTVPIQFAQNIGQTFLGINLKCASCHDSFVDRWTLKQTYDLAAIVSDTPLELHRCEKATGRIARPSWLFDQLGQIDADALPSERLIQLATLITHSDNGWLSRNLVNRLWARLMGRGLVHPVDALRMPPWSEELLEILAHELVDSQWNIKHVLNIICSSEIYGVATPAIQNLPKPSQYIFQGPSPRRMTAEQLSDAIWQLTGSAPKKSDAVVTRFEPSDTTVIEPTSKWIWSNASASAQSGEKRSFRKIIDLEKQPEHAIAVIATDNEGTLFINGEKITVSHDWSNASMTVITNVLHQGKNTILVSAANGAAGGPAALRVEIAIKAPGHTIQAYGTDDTWQWTTVAPNKRGRFAKNNDIAWAPAVITKTQSIWKTGEKSFRASLQYVFSPDTIPMVRASLIKATPLMSALGRPNRDQVVTNRPTQLTTLEALQLSNDASLNGEFLSGASKLFSKYGSDSKAIIERVFLTALTRLPTPAEYAAASDLLGATCRETNIADLMWAIVMLPEFQLIR